MVLVLMDHGLAPPVAAIHGCWTTKAMQLVPATVTEAIRVFAVRQNPRQSTPAVIVTAMEAGRNIPAVSIGAKAIAGIVVHPAMITLRTA